MEHKKEIIAIKEQYSSFSRENKIKLRELFIKRSGISYPAFYTKMKDGRFTPLEIEALKDIVSQISEASKEKDLQNKKVS